MSSALLAAVLGMLGYGLGTVLQAAGARRGNGLAVMRQPLYLAGLCCDGVAWLASLLALQRLPLFVVQAVLAGSIPVTVVLAWLFLGGAIRRRDAAAVVLVVLALVVVAGASGAESAAQAPPWFPAAALVVLAAVAVATWRSYRRAQPLPMATLAGLAFSGAALGARVTHVPSHRAALLLDPVAWAVVGFGVVGAVALSRALERGAVGTVTSVAWLVEVLVPGVAGVVALGDTVRPGWAWAAGAASGLAIVGCLLLATSPAHHQLEDQQRPQPAASSLELPGRPEDHPPATAGMIETFAPSGTGDARPPEKRTSSSPT